VLRLVLAQSWKHVLAHSVCAEFKFTQKRRSNHAHFVLLESLRRSVTCRAWRIKSDLGTKYIIGPIRRNGKNTAIPGTVSCLTTPHGRLSIVDLAPPCVP